MPQSKSDEIRLVFLEEAEKHLKTIQSAIYQLAADSRLEQHELNEVIRATHSIKGGARMTGFECLGNLACRMEDFFEVFKTRIHKRNPELEYLLLLAQETLWKVFGINREGEEVNEQWLQTNAHPLFEQLDLILKDLTPAESDNSALEEPQSVVALILKSELDECLQRLESAGLEADKANLSKEVSEILDSLIEVGDALGIVGWNRLWNSIAQDLKAFPERVEEIAQLADLELRMKLEALGSGRLDDLTEQLHNTRNSAPSEQKKIENSSALPVQLSILPSARFNVEDFSELRSDLAFDLNYVEEINQSQQFGISSNKLKQLLEMFVQVNKEHEHTSELIEHLLRQHERSSHLLLVLRDEIEQLGEQANSTQFSTIIRKYKIQ